MILADCLLITKGSNGSVSGLRVGLENPVAPRRGIHDAVRSRFGFGPPGSVRVRSEFGSGISQDLVRHDLSENHLQIFRANCSPTVRYRFGPRRKAESPKENPLGFLSFLTQKRSVRGTHNPLVPGSSPGGPTRHTGHPRGARFGWFDTPQYENLRVRLEHRDSDARERRRLAAAARRASHVLRGE